MPLNLAALSQQLTELGQHARALGPAEEAALDLALKALRANAADYDRLGKIAQQRDRAPFRAALPLGPLDLRGALPTLPADHTIIATDGSQIEPDRHGPVLCHLINLGSALIRYGRQPSASLVSKPLLRFRREELYLEPNSRHPMLIQERVLGLQRAVAETTRLADLAEAEVGEEGEGRVVLGLQDGTLLLSSWGQGSESRALDVLINEFLAGLSRLRRLGVPLASYVSRPRSSDVVNLLRLAICPWPDETCDEHCRGKSPLETECAVLAEVPDRAVFAALPLALGERGAIFRSSWSTSLAKYGEHEIHFFYLNVGDEIARVEVPEWVADDVDLLNLVHAAVVCQSRLGQGYPRALIEAHEQAVVTASDRRGYEALVSLALQSAGLRPTASEKELSKRIRSF